MNFKIFDDLLGSAPEASQEFRFREGKPSAKHNSAKIIEKFLENLHKILKIFKTNFKNF